MPDEKPFGAGLIPAPAPQVVKNPPPGPVPMVLDEERIYKLAAIMCTTEEIAYVMGCSKDTLERRFHEKLEEGRAQGRMSVRRKQYELAIGGNPTMLIWLGKQYLGQRDRQELDHSGNLTLEQLIMGSFEHNKGKT